MMPLSRIRGLPALFVAILSHAAFTAFAQPPVGYYDSVDSSSAAALRSTLHAIIDDHTLFPYTSAGTDTWDILELADEDPNNSSHILDIYKNAGFLKQGGVNSFYNREHAWPKSYGFPDDDGQNYPFTDCHALFLAEIGYNASRSNKPYRNCTAGCDEMPTDVNNDQGGGSGVFPGNSNWTMGEFTQGTWQTWPGRKGDVARALFYMDVRYEGGLHGITGAPEPDLILTDLEALIENSFTGNNESVAYMGMLSVLLQWHDEDPVDALEMSRHEVVFSFQGNRNPFIDHPEWAGCVFAGECGGVLGSGDPTIIPWINEIHYDNTGADTGEFIEIAGPSGTRLSGWRVIGYNGNGGGIYKTIGLTGTFPDQGGCMGTLAFDFTPMQNGAPDGLALIDDSGAVVEFISYEGELRATAGPAVGMTAMDIGVQEISSTPVGDSLQKTGTGSGSSDFTWQFQQPSTRGLPNADQSFTGCRSEVKNWIGYP